uniref:Pleurain-N antimicrobial peptide n=1 Tax=Nidirana pleuraden TaxID=369511 RepID=B5L1L8_NIDPL|nr:pleurain-N antimicrobial peptide precursor [Nidirana pleuraden]
MFTLKKSLLLIFFLGIISFSLSEQERGTDEDDGGEKIKQRVKRGFFDRIKALTKNVTLELLNTITCKLPVTPP